MYDDINVDTKHYFSFKTHNNKRNVFTGVLCMIIQTKL